VRKVSQIGETTVSQIFFF